MLSAAVLRQFVPLSSLPPDARAELARGARVGTYKRGQVVFERGDAARTAAFLLSGEVELVSLKATERIRAGTPESRHAISRAARSASTATCVADGQVLFVDREHLDLALTWSQSGGLEVTELTAEAPRELQRDAAARDLAAAAAIDADEEEAERDWMTALLANPAFHRIPPGNIPRIFAALEPVELAPGEAVVREGEAGDAWFVVTKGRVRVRRGAEPVVLLGVGRTFGEEALVSGAPRNATVEAVTPVEAMRLPAAQFEALLKAPLFREVTVDDVPDTAQLVDVRLAEEYRNGRLPGAISLPLATLREDAGKLASDREYVVYCDSGRRSAAATYLLSERGFDARLLKGGIPAEEMPVRG